MAIKVRHEGNLTSRVVAGSGSGEAKRAMESAALIRPHQVQLTHGATAQAHAPSGGHAQLIHAPLGGGGSAPLIHAPAASGRSGLGGSSRSATGPSGGDDYKVTGSSVFSRPDDESQWDPTNGGRWIRPWQPGEKEAEALSRRLAVSDPYERSMLNYRNSLGMESAAYNRLLGMAGMPKRGDKRDISPLEQQFNALYESAISAVNERARGAVPLDGRSASVPQPTPFEAPARQDVTTQGGDGVGPAYGEGGQVLGDGTGSGGSGSDSSSDLPEPTDYGDIGFLHGFDW